MKQPQKFAVFFKDENGEYQPYYTRGGDKEFITFSSQKEAQDSLLSYLDENYEDGEDVFICKVIPIASCEGPQTIPAKIVKL